MSRITLASLFLLSFALCSVRAESMNENSAVWRWTTTTVLDAQRASQQPVNSSPFRLCAALRAVFVQRPTRRVALTVVRPAWVRGVNAPQLTPSLRCRFVDEVVYWNVEPLVRIDVAVDPLRRQRAFVEAGQDQLQLAGVGVDVADGENARHVGLEFSVFDRDEVFVRFRPQSATGPSFMVRPKNGSKSSQSTNRRSCRRLLGTSRPQVRRRRPQGGHLAEQEVHLPGWRRVRASH